MKLFVFACLLLSFVCISPVHAQSPAEDEPLAMKEIVVTASRDTQEVRKAPANVTVITAAEIQASGATSVVDLLDKLESIKFHTYSGNASQSMIDMRGFGGDNPFGKTLILLDGRRLNRTDMASVSWLSLPVNNIERIEIVRGPGSVLYGDAAIGGVINIITKKGSGKPAFTISGLAGSYGLRDGRAGLTGAAGKWTYAVVGQYNHIDGYRDRSEYSAQSAGFDLGYNAHRLINLSLNASFNRTDYQMPGALTKEQMRQNRRQYQPAMYYMNAHPDDDGRDKHTNVIFGLKSFWGSFGHAEADFIYGRKDLQMNMPSWGSAWSSSNYIYSDTTADTYGVTPKYIWARNFFGFHNKLTAGVDYYREPYRKEIYNDRERAERLSRADFTRQSVGFYIRDEFAILKNLIFSAGARFEKTKIEGSNTDFSPSGQSNNFNQSKDYKAQAYEAGLTWLFGEKSKAFARYATVYRIPFLDEIASFNGFAGERPFLLALDKEKGKSMEAGIEYCPLERLKLALTVFRIDMRDEIEYFMYDPAMYLGENRNVGKTRHDGVEFSVSYLWREYLKAYGNFTYHRATYQAGEFNKKAMPMVPNRIINAGLEIYLPYRIVLRPEIRHVSEAFLSGDNDNNTSKLDAYTLMNFYVYYRPSFGRLNMTIFAGVENLTDTMYSSFGVDYQSYGMENFYYPMPGRTVKGGLTIEF